MAEVADKLVSSWSHSREAWKSLQILFEGRTTTRVHFNLINSALVPPQSGIYVICLGPVENGNGFLGLLYNSMYVGKSKSLQKRFKQHLKGGTGVQHIVKMFPNLDFWFVVCPEEEMSLLEKSLYDVLLPPNNAIAPPAPLKVTLGTPVPANIRKAGTTNG